MAEQRPELVTEAPATFRVRSVPHGDAVGIESELDSAESDGYALERTLAQANGDVLLFFRRGMSAAAGAEEA